MPTNPPPDHLPPEWLATIRKRCANPLVLSQNVMAVLGDVPALLDAIEQHVVALAEKCGELAEARDEIAKLDGAVEKTVASKNAIIVRVTSELDDARGEVERLKTDNATHVAFIEAVKKQAAHDAGVLTRERDDLARRVGELELSARQLPEFIRTPRQQKKYDAKLARASARSTATPENQKGATGNG